jgi:hypothetical protein
MGIVVDAKELSGEMAQFVLERLVLDGRTSHREMRTLPR